jgi:hypothetical protein
MKREANRDWNEIFKSVEQVAGITLNEEIRKRIIELYHSFHHVYRGPRFNSKQIEQRATRLLIALQPCTEKFHFYSDAKDCIVLDRSLDALSSVDALVRAIRCSRGRTVRGRRPATRVDGLIAELGSCYEATGGRVAFRKNSEGHVVGRYADFLKAMRQHVFQSQVLASDQAFIHRARRSRLFIRRQEQRRLTEMEWVTQMLQPEERSRKLPK